MRTGNKVGIGKKTYIIGVRLAAVAGLAAVVLTGCQTTPARTGWNGYQLEVERLPARTAGWVMADMRMCMRAYVDGEAKERECERSAGLMTQFTEEALEAGYEEPAFATRSECERAQRFQIKAQRLERGTFRMQAQTDQIRCERFEGTTTEGRGWHVWTFQMCSNQGCGRNSGIDPELAEAMEQVESVFTLIGPLIEGGFTIPTYSSKEACGDALSYKATLLLHDEDFAEAVTEGEAGAGTLAQAIGAGDDLKMRVRCKRYRTR